MAPAAFRHEACFYDGAEGFVAAVAPFVRDGLAAGDAVLVVAPGEKLGRLRDELGVDAGDARFADLTMVGRNPARIIPAWTRFLADATASGRTARGVGEPIHAACTADELRECHIHESLLNTAFAGGTPWWLLCPYDRSTLDDLVLDRARRTHPWVDHRPSDAHRLGPGEALEVPLSDPPDDVPVVELAFDLGTLRDVRRAVLAHGEAVGLDGRSADLVLAVHELATNSTIHGGGRGLLRAWWDHATRSLVVEVADDGRIDDPLVGRVEPPVDRIGGRGVWICNQLCDLVQIRSTPSGTTVRVHMAPQSDYVSA